MLAAGTHEVGADCGEQQHRSDRCDSQMQRRNLLEVATSQWDLFEPRWCRRMVDHRPVTTTRILIYHRRMLRADDSDLILLIAKGLRW